MAIAQWHMVPEAWISWEERRDGALALQMQQQQQQQVQIMHQQQILIEQQLELQRGQQAMLVPTPVFGKTGAGMQRPPPHKTKQRPHKTVRGSHRRATE